MATSISILKSQPGIKRDGTAFDGDYYTDGQWMRFQRGLPRKIGGYRSINKYLSEISRGLTSFPQQALQYCHSGSASKLQRFTIDSSKNSSIISDRTPAGLTVSDYNMWMFDYAFDSSTTDNSIIAHVAPNGQYLNNDTGGQIFIGDVTGTAALTAVTLPAGTNATGGIVCLHPYLFYYGTSGVIGWSVAGSPADLTGVGSGASRPWSKKIIKGIPLRSGGGSGPSGLFWADDAVIRATFTGGSTVFQFDVIATDTSIMSPDSVVDFDGTFYWLGVDRFLVFNGVVRDVPNMMNMNWLFDNINMSQRSKVFGFKVPKYGEIWWCYPRGDATECTHAIIYNVRENSWYDTELPSSGRSAAVFNNEFAAPLMVEAISQSASGFRTWIHEQGVDEVDQTTTYPINSYFETCDLSSVANGGDTRMRVTAIEPDFIQSGDMTVTVTGRANTRTSDIRLPSKTITDPTPSNYNLPPDQQIVYLKNMRREIRFKFQSNVVGGDYQMGQILIHLGEGDKTVLR